MSNTQNTVTPETALRLKAAGFPQPDYATFGQFWLETWDEDDPEIIVIYEDDFFNPIDKTMVYMPTIPDLLSELGKIVIRRTTRKGKFIYNVEKRVSNEEIDVISDTNLAEALALIWEKMNNN